MTLKQQLQEDMKTAMRSHDADTLTTIRMALAALKQIEVDERIEISDERFIATLSKMIKQRHESVRMYEEGHRHDLAEKEQAEIGILQKYLPEMLDTASLKKIITETIAKTGANKMSDMGKVMGQLKQPLTGKADMAEVCKIIKQMLSA